MPGHAGAQIELQVGVSKGFAVAQSLNWYTTPKSVAVKNMVSCQRTGVQIFHTAGDHLMASRNLFNTPLSPELSSDERIVGDVYFTHAPFACVWPIRALTVNLGSFLAFHS